MELPHLTLALRRFWRTPGRLTVVFLLFWLVVVLMEALQPRWIYLLLAGQPYSAQMNLTALAYLLIAFVGYFSVYYVIAANMRQIADRAAVGHWGWFATPIGNSAVLRGILAGTLLAVVVPMAGLLAFVSLRANFIQQSFGNDVPVGFQLGLDGLNATTFLIFFSLRLLNFACVAGCLHLAFRPVRFSGSLPALLALAATAIQFWEGRYLFDIALHPRLAESQPQDWLLVGLGGTVILAVVLVQAVRIGRFSLWHLVLILAFLVVPVFTGTTSVINDVVFHRKWRNQGLRFDPEMLQTYTYTTAAMPVHAVLGNVFPGLESVFNERNTAGSEFTRWAGAMYKSHERCDHWYGVPGQTGLHILLASLGYLASLALWWFTAVLCLGTARYPGRPLFRRRTVSVRGP